MKYIIALLLLVTGFPLYGQGVNFSGYVRGYSGMFAGNDNYDFVILQNTLNLVAEKKGEGSSFKVNPYFYHYKQDSLVIGMREAYVDLEAGNFALRLGKQQIVWGKADGVFITDIISPKNLEEFLLPDFSEIRMGVTGAKLNYYFENNTIELVFLPVFTPTKLPAKSSVWSPVINFPVAPVFDYSQSEVKPTLENSEIFLKYSSLTGSIDYEVMAGYMWDDDAVMYTSMSPNGAGGMNLKLTPQHHRLAVAGGSFSTTVGPLVLRGEGAFYSGKKFMTTTPQLNSGITEKDYIHYMAGTDFALYDVQVSTQIIQKSILDYSSDLQSNYSFNGENSTMITLLLKYSTLHETLDFELFSYYDFEFDDSLIRPRVVYDYSDSINLQFGANIFTGNSGQFGQYNLNDMIYGKILYNF